MPVIIIRSEKEYVEELYSANGKMVVVDFHAQWCGPCRNISPAFEALCEEYGDGAKFLKVDVGDDENMEISKKENIRSLPTFIIFKDGYQVHSQIGANIELLKHHCSEIFNRMEGEFHETFQNQN